MKILLAEDHDNLREIIEDYLVVHGYVVESFDNGEDAYYSFLTESYDLVLLDVMMPKMDGFTLCKKIREKEEIPILFITAKVQEVDQLKGYELGCDDYIIKPFEIIELIARVETVLRRYNKISRYLSVYDIVVDTSSRVVKKNNEIINLTMKEYDLLVLFIRNKNIALFRDSIYENIWHESYLGDSRTVDLHVQRMRKKLGLEDKIVPLYKIGYRLEVEE